MKALTIKNPWAALIVLGIKDVENRTWRTKYRGKILIHTSKQYDTMAVDFVIGKKLMTQKEWVDEKVEKLKYQYGYIIGEVEIVDCIRDSKSGWAEEGCWHWVLKNPVIYDKAIPAKGKLSLWEFEQ